MITDNKGAFHVKKGHSNAKITHPPPHRATHTDRQTDKGFMEFHAKIARDLWGTCFCGNMIVWCTGMSKGCGNNAINTNPIHQFHQESLCLSCCMIYSTCWSVERALCTWLLFSPHNLPSRETFFWFHLLFSGEVWSNSQPEQNDKAK